VASAVSADRVRVQVFVKRDEKKSGSPALAPWAHIAFVYIFNIAVPYSLAVVTQWLLSHVKADIRRPSCLHR
jgi:hypothetical protein